VESAVADVSAEHTGRNCVAERVLAECVLDRADTVAHAEELAHVVAPQDEGGRVRIWRYHG
jgi:hypothetical protein